VLLVTINADCPQSPANPEDRRADRSKVRVATFNAEWLFPGNDTVSVSPWTSLQAEEHLINVSQAIYQLNPDILGLQEVFDCTILERLIEKLNHLGATGYKGYLVQGTDTATRQNVALLTRVDPISNLWQLQTGLLGPSLEITATTTVLVELLLLANTLLQDSISVGNFTPCSTTIFWPILLKQIDAHNEKHKPR
jgi:hypothetical protein